MPFSRGRHATERNERHQWHPLDDVLRAADGNSGCHKAAATEKPSSRSGIDYIVGPSAAFTTFVKT
jgi:hypothetical protein